MKKPTTRLELRVDARLRADLEAMAEDDGLSLSQFLRGLIITELARRQPPLRLWGRVEAELSELRSDVKDELVNRAILNELSYYSEVQDEYIDYPMAVVTYIHHEGCSDVIVDRYATTDAFHERIKEIERCRDGRKK